VIPRDGQESVWDYPRPPALLTDSRLVTVRAEGLVIAESDHSYRVCETASPPTFYLSPSHVDWSLLTHVEVSSRAKFSKLKNHICFYPERVECYVDGERVRPQPGPFYGGWISDDVVGPFKGGPGTGHW
jgi:uncharacterized protein (DUF427 family)